MEFNRNHYLVLGVIVFLLGLQLRLVESYTLNDHASRFVAARVSGGQSGSVLAGAGAVGGRKTLSPPPWVGWCLLSVGSVLVLHSLAMKKPGG